MKCRTCKYLDFISVECKNNKINKNPLKCILNNWSEFKGDLKLSDKEVSELRDKVLTILNLTNKWSGELFVYESGEVDILGDVRISDPNITELGFNIRYLKGQLLLKNCVKLKSTKGFPKKLTGELNITNTSIESFTGESIKVGSLICNNGKLKSLEGLVSVKNLIKITQCKEFKEFGSSLRSVKTILVESREILDKLPSNVKYTHLICLEELRQGSHLPNKSFK